MNFFRVTVKVTVYYRPHTGASESAFGRHCAL